MGKLKILFTTLLFLSFIFTSQAQSIVIKDLPISVGYYGENGIHPGLKIGTSYTFWSKEKIKTYRFKSRTEKYGSKNKLKELSLDFNLGGYSHPNNHSGYFSNIGITYLRTKTRKRRQLGVSFEIGYLRRFNKLTTYELDENGAIKKVNFAGNNALVIALSPIFAKEFEFRARHMRYFIKPSLQYLKYNEKFQPNATLEVGLVFNIARKEK